ncbi:long-chain-fatty-acid--CoA ligase 1 isoform X1 [Apis mellifera caucasica]|uniref:Long-chain-fatty-acid--CoA ligase n=2 Tax=Apis mellifera TaxID=7460 RepID=A0A7M7TFC9_APIME|nr:long-chain-fatty-acid--CoA ligase 1 isoform X1 [Apis mellifera]KAG6801806.1 long-chain-fatty-acid--CoA ligase 1 isoform X1 [Apis mellifera caucasica]KAG9429091.1 long-chain-fatty-acid--CoA ligase 1 isoform X1 [Apis mellifera carnica]|eukprot:XP_395996.1 long-chain-fatty-acid--CoA ligase 1 isoform X1 [Apis mellifera]
MTSGCFSPPPIRPPIDLNDQSDTVKGTDLIKVSRFYKDSKEGKFVSFLYEDTRTLYDGFRKGAKESNNGPCLGWRDGPNKPYQWLHYNETLLRAKNFGSGLVSLGLMPGSHTLIGLYSQNCPEWILTEQACYTYSLVVVPLYDTLGPDACAFIINQAEINLVVVENDTKCNLLLDKAPRCLRKLVVIKETRQTTNQRAKNRGVELLKFDDVERLGAQKNHPEVPPKSTDLCTISYTSGTTGNPKGVMLTHQNVIAGISAVLVQLGEHKPSYKDTMISFLPLAHMLERCCENGMYMVGGSVGFYSGDIKRLSEDMKALRPTVMPAVPRLLNRMYDKIQTELQNSCLKKLVFSLGMRAKEAEIKKGIIRNNSIWDKLVFSKIKESTGGRVRLMVVGSAPLAGNVLTFTRCALGCLIVEGYGQTECCAPITLTVQGDHVPEHVGPPVPCCCIKLVDVPEMEYYAKKNQGEVCVKGTNVFVGYFKDPERTAQAIDEYGWHHTGDVGMWLPNGTLKIIDRRKHTFKLSQGEYIVPEKIENIYLRSQYVHQVFVHGESLKSCVVGIVIPDVDVVKCWAVENGIPGTLSVLCANPQVKQLIMDDMLSWGKEAGLKSFEQVKDIYLHPDPFSIQNGLLTPSLKMKRPQLKDYFKPQIEDLYRHLD